ncbi:hypothetical protein [Aliagarivorans taiwanensis]|uniref:hypothetical protein n=1 Tax=Aliagarivorans taiwanensis TaxID=561966 RepID=UPI00042417F9|nr:hypothetical protein [Aliagarivorans taiwanensis]
MNQSRRFTYRSDIQLYFAQVFMLAATHCATHWLIQHVAPATYETLWLVDLIDLLIIGLLSLDFAAPARPFGCIDRFSRGLVFLALALYAIAVLMGNHGLSTWWLTAIQITSMVVLRLSTKTRAALSHHPKANATLNT